MSTTVAAFTFYIEYSHDGHMCRYYLEDKRNNIILSVKSPTFLNDAYYGEHSVSNLLYSYKINLLRKNIPYEWLDDIEIVYDKEKQHYKPQHKTSLKAIHELY